MGVFPPIKAYRTAKQQVVTEGKIPRLTGNGSTLNATNRNSRRIAATKNETKQ